MTLKEIEDKLDLKKKFPNYFDKRIYRTLTIILFVLFIFSLYLNNWQIINVELKCESEEKCFNPFYPCANPHFIEKCPVNKIQQKIGMF